MSWVDCVVGLQKPDQERVMISLYCKIESLKFGNKQTNKNGKAELDVQLCLQLCDLKAAAQSL